MGFFLWHLSVQSGRWGMYFCLKIPANLAVHLKVKKRGVIGRIFEIACSRLLVAEIWARKTRSNMPYPDASLL